MHRPNTKSKTSLNYTEKLLLKIEKGKYQLNSNEKDKKNRDRYYATINRLMKYNFIIVEKKGNNRIIKLTPKGIIKVQRIKWRQLNLKENKQKNYKTCVIIFDIPEKVKRMRELFRKCLYELGFKKIQKSVFLGPQEALPYVKLITKSCGIQKHVIVLMGNKSNTLSN